MAIDIISDTTGKEIVAALNNLAGSGTNSGNGASLEVINLQESENYTITKNGISLSNAYGFKKYGKLVVISMIGSVPSSATVQPSQTIIRGLPTSDRDTYAFMCIGTTPSVCSIKANGEIVYKGADDIPGGSMLFINAAYLTNEE